jgi:hypothetical protein
MAKGKIWTTWLVISPCYVCFLSIKCDKTRSLINEDIFIFIVKKNLLFIFKYKFYLFLK